jgi:hypothetical protein
MILDYHTSLPVDRRIPVFERHPWLGMVVWMSGFVAASFILEILRSFLRV